jgi:hypothetical protein
VHDVDTALGDKPVQRRTAAASSIALSWLPPISSRWG